MNDWSEGIVLLHPLTRKLEGQLNRREYREAEETANDLADLISDIKRVLIRKQCCPAEV